MLFISLTFVYFFLVTLLAHWALPDRARSPFLLVASYFFYMFWGPIYGLLLGGATVWTFLCGRALERWQDRRRLVVGVGVTACLGTLALFKYGGFFAEQAFALIDALGYEEPPVEVDIVLPLGVSFYLFQMISYLVDVYRGAKAEASLLTLALYVSFFTQLVAGPIVRAGELCGQLKAKRRFDGERFSEGMYLMLRGFVKKTVIADNLAVWVQVLFDDPDKYGTWGNWIGVMAYAGQIYCDFSGYTDIARGAASMLGFSLPENFDLPYLASDPQEFWRRWHMTLSRWLRDYLYIPLGGNRKGKVRTQLNLMITMALGGLWHGADWRFVVWGVFHGVWLVLHRVWCIAADRVGILHDMRRHGLFKLIAIPVTFALVCVSWVFFRADDMTVAGEVLTRMFGAFPQAETPAEMAEALRYLVLLGAAHLFGAYAVGLRLHRAAPAMARGVGWAIMIMICFWFGETTTEFIYFQF